MGTASPTITELRQLLQTASYASRIQSIQDIASLWVQSNEAERYCFSQYCQHILELEEIIALTADILKEAAECESNDDLTPQDALIYASVMSHLHSSKPQQACFLN